ncbi:MAG: chromosomal replication initiator protein DnaA [Clostridia bacterium]|nr:chromosomal replication initiator protein DnaA [Clostridia bacterium]
MDTIGDVWNEVRSICKTKFSSDSMYRLWIEPLELVKFENDTFIFIISSEFKKTIIMDKFSDIIKESFEEVMGFPVEIDILVSANKPVLKSSDDDEKPAQEIREFTFDNFIVGKSNDFAYSVSLGVAANPGTLHNPLLIYGRSGLGKTHLLLAINHELRLRFPDMVIIYTTGEDMMSELISALKVKNTVPFRNKYRNVDALLVDDIQFIKKSEAFQEEFFHTFDTLHRAGKQIVITSDVPPREMLILDERLRTRFEQGILADVQPPDYDTRKAIIINKCEQLELKLGNKLIDYIAQNVKNNIRQIEGTVNKISAYTKAYGGTITENQIKDIVKDVTTDSKPLSEKIENIISYIAKSFGVSSSDVKSDKRQADINTARQLSMYVIKEVTSMTLQDIGKLFGKNHSTVLHSIAQAKEKTEENTQLKVIFTEAVDEFRKE